MKQHMKHSLFCRLYSSLLVKCTSDLARAVARAAQPDPRALVPLFVLSGLTSACSPPEILALTEDGDVLEGSASVKVWCLDLWNMEG